MSERKESTIGKEFTLPELFRFVAPPVVTRLLVSLLSTLDDSLFVSRFLGQNALAAFSVAMPWFMFVDAIGMMFSSVSVICSIKMGEGKHDEAKSDFSTSLVFLLGIGAFLTLILSLFLHPILRILGETEILMPYAEEFFRVSRFYLPLILINYVFNSFYVIAGKPKCSMYASAINMIFQFFFDWLFIVKLKIGIAGAAYANLMGSLAVTLFAVVFYSNRSREVCFVKPQSRISALLKLIFRYGRMQAITSLAISFGSYVTNRVQLHIGGEEVVAAYTIVSNVTFMFMNSFFGLISSTSPLVSYAYGEKNARKLARACRQTVILVTGLMCLIIILIMSGKGLILRLYLTETSSDRIRQMVSRGLTIYPLSLIFFGYNVLVQEFSNVLGKHKTSLFLSMMENFVFQNVASILLPYLFGVNGVWFVFMTAEFLTFFLTAYCVYANRNVYGYGKEGIATFVNN